jgi:methylmalonyl-CoA epimerase
MIEQIDHIGIAVKSLEDGIRYYEQTLGLKCEAIEEVASQKVKTAFFHVGEVHLELLEATDPESPIAKFLEKNGEGIHHIAFRTNDIEGQLKQAADAGTRLIHEIPFEGSGEQTGRLPAPEIDPRRPDRILRQQKSATVPTPCPLIQKTERPREPPPGTAMLGGGEAKQKARHEKGMLTARERLEPSFDPNTFQEFGMHAQHSCKNFGMEKKKMPSDGVVTGIGYVEGRPVAAFAHDFTVGGGALGRIHAKKVCDLMDYAIKAGMPVLGINDSGGARIQEGVDSLSGYGRIFFRNVQCSGLVPQIAIIAGPCAGGAAYSPALTDFLIMTRENANMFICGPQVIQAATGEKAELAQFATADAHASMFRKHPPHCRG